MLALTFIDKCLISTQSHFIIEFCFYSCHSRKNFYGYLYQLNNIRKMWVLNIPFPGSSESKKVAFALDKTLMCTLIIECQIDKTGLKTFLPLKSAWKFPSSPVTWKLCEKFKAQIICSIQIRQFYTWPLKSNRL